MRYSLLEDYKVEPHSVDRENRHVAFSIKCKLNLNKILGKKINRKDISSMLSQLQMPRHICKRDIYTIELTERGVVLTDLRISKRPPDIIIKLRYLLYLLDIENELISFNQWNFKYNKVNITIKLED